jgi:hypothetical protein
MVVVLSISPLRAQNAREIVNRYLDTVSSGDIKNWDKIKSTYTESESYYSQSNFDGKFNLLKPEKSSFNKIYTVWPQQRSDSYSDSTFSNLTSSFYFLKDKTVIIIGNIPPMIKQPSPRDEFDSEFLPLTIWKLLNKSKSVELVGLREFALENITCYEIKIAVKERVYFLFINTQTFLLEYWNGREDNDTSILVKYTDYRKIGDVLIPMYDCLIRNNIIYFWSRKKLIHINRDIDPEILKYEEK